MLAFDPSKRIAVKAALEHDYLKECHSLDDEPVCSHVLKGDFDFEIFDLNKEQLKDLIYEEILMYHFPEKLEEYNNIVKQGKSTMCWV